jgi:hypothetical protein
MWVYYKPTFRLHLQGRRNNASASEEKCYTVTNRLLQFGGTESTDITLEGEGGLGTSTNSQWGGARQTHSASGLAADAPKGNPRSRYRRHVTVIF